MYPMLERIMPRARKLELFARMHNCQAGWIALGNQLNGVHFVDEGLRARFKAANPDVEVQPASPPRASSAMEVDSNAVQARNPFGGGELKTSGTPYVQSTAPGPAHVSQEKPTSPDVEMTS